MDGGGDIYPESGGRDVDMRFLLFTVVKQVSSSDCRPREEYTPEVRDEEIS